MKTPQSLRSGHRRFVLVWVAVAAAFAFSAPLLYAQAACPDGSDIDALGCSTQPATQSFSKESISALSVQERPQSETPSPDLSGGASYSEVSTQTGPPKSGVRAAPADPPNEFQRFVYATIGQLPPIYGVKFFSTQPTSFGPIERGPAPGELIIGTDDELRIRIWGQVNFSANLRVSREGEIYLPKVGAVHVAGMPFSSIPAHLRSLMEPVYRNFELSIDLGTIHTIQIYVTGMARHPGDFTVSGLSTLMDAVFACGGPSAKRVYAPCAVEARWQDCH